MYYEGGVSSVYLWDLDEQQGKELAFAGVVLLKKSMFPMALMILYVKVSCS